MKRKDVQIYCAIILLITTVYLYPRLYGIEKIAWGLWGMAIFIGTLMCNKQTKKRKKK